LRNFNREEYDLLNILRDTCCLLETGQCTEGIQSGIIAGTNEHGAYCPNKNGDKERN
jgi:hypothetical protein